VGKFLNINNFYVSFTEKDSGRAFRVSKPSTKGGENIGLNTGISHFLLYES
jgi:hypothetical protein